MSIKLSNITNKNENDLYKVVSNANVMKYVGDRKIWNRKKTKKFIQYTIQERKNNIKDILYCKITNSRNSFVGIVGIHKYENEKEHSVTIYLSDKYQGKGYGTKALNQIIDKFHKKNPKVRYIYFKTLSYNYGAQRLAHKAGFTWDNNFNFSGERYIQYVYDTKYHKVLKLEYPYLSNFITKRTLTKNFNELKKYKAEIKNGSNKKFKDNMKIIVNFEKERNMNRITDYFTDICRVKCLFKGYKLTPLQYYKGNKGYLINKSIVNNKFNIDKFESVMYNLKDTKLCNNFQPTLALTIYKIFKATKILDSSAGWGDRLVAAIAGGMSYTGVDPSKCLKPLYKKIIKELAPKKNIKKYEIINKPFEDAKITGKYDLCFTSPPFFDVEKYEDNSNQSISRYMEIDEWVRDFLIPLAEKNISHLKKGGHFVIYVPDYFQFMDFMKKYKKVKYLGVMSFLTPVKRDIYVWKKL